MHCMHPSITITDTVLPRLWLFGADAGADGF